jgi:hypothetical protein
LVEQRTQMHMQCIWEETTDLPQVNWQTFTHSHIGTSRMQIDAGCMRFIDLANSVQRIHKAIHSYFDLL